MKSIVLFSVESRRTHFLVIGKLVFVLTDSHNVIYSCCKKIFLQINIITLWEITLWEFTLSEGLLPVAGLKG